MPVRRLCVCIICGYRWGAMARVMFAVGLGEAVWYGVSSIQAAMAPPHRRPRPPSPSPKNAVIYPSIWVEHIWMCQTVWCKYGLYLWYVTTFRRTFLSVTHHVRTYVCTYVFCENRSSIQSLTLMCSATTLFVEILGDTLLTNKGTLLTNKGALCWQARGHWWQTWGHWWQTWGHWWQEDTSLIPQAQQREEEKVWLLLFAHVLNYP